MIKSYEKVIIEISNVCNARCKWCTTGSKINVVKNRKFMTSEEFKIGLNYLLENSIIDKDTAVELYNWGEPFLNPNIKEILDEICNNNLKYHLSTNGTQYLKFKNKWIYNLEYLTYSLPGFSYASYQRIHKISFELVINNIRKTAIEFKNLGLQNKIIVNYHIYQFNLEEIEKAKEFCNKLGISFIPTLAYFNDFDTFNQYRLNTIKIEKLLEASKELILNFYDELIKEMPENYICPESNYLVLSNKFEIVPCCRLTEKDSLGSLFSLNLKDIRAIKSNLKQCEICKKTKQHFITHYKVLIPKWYEINERNLKIAIKQRDEVYKMNEEYDKNLKVAIKQRDEAYKTNEEYDKNLKIAIKQRDEAYKTNEEYDKNLKIAMKQRDEAYKTSKEYEENLKIAIKQRDEAYKTNEEYDKNLKIVLDQKKKLEESLTQFMEGKASITNELNKTKNELSLLKEELLIIKTNKVYKTMKKLDKRLK